jgi:uncharacterized protein
MNYFSATSLADFALAFSSIVLQTLPFLLLGALVSASIDQFLPEAWLTRFLRGSFSRGAWTGVLAGFFFPLCECGALPVVRRLILRGVSVPVAATYLFSSSILNPLCVISTLMAFRGSLGWWILGARLGGGLFVIALLVAVIRWWPAARLLRRGLAEQVSSCSHAGHSHGSVGALGPWGRVKAFSQGVTHDFMSVVIYVILAAALAAWLTTNVARESWAPLFDDRFIGPLASSGLAYLLCLCSTTDAFIAASAPTLPLAATLAFLIAGPLFDLRLAVLYASLFSWRLVVTLGLVTTGGTWLWVQLWW